MLDGRNFDLWDSWIDSWCTYSSNLIENQIFKYCLTAWRRQQDHGCVSAEHDHVSDWSLHLPFTASHLDCRSSSSHVDKVLPLQDGPEAALQRDDSPQHFLVEEGLKTLTLRLPQEHLNNTRTFTYMKSHTSWSPTDKMVKQRCESAPSCCPLDTQQVAGGSAGKTPWCLIWLDSCLEEAAHESDAQSPGRRTCVCVVNIFN